MYGELVEAVETARGGEVEPDPTPRLVGLDRVTNRSVPAAGPDL
jgi:hypothetical protein